MKISLIFQALNALLAVAEQVASMIVDAKIPADEQETVEIEVDRALKRLEYAKAKIAVDPIEE